MPAGLQASPGRRRTYPSYLTNLSLTHHSHGLNSSAYPPHGLAPRGGAMCLIIFCCVSPFSLPRLSYTPLLPSPLIISPPPSPYRCVSVSKNLSYGKPSGATIFLRKYPRQCVTVSTCALLSICHLTGSSTQPQKFFISFNKAYCKHRKPFLDPRKHQLHTQCSHHATTCCEQVSSKDPTLVGYTSPCC